MHELAHAYSMNCCGASCLYTYGASFCDLSELSDAGVGGCYVNRKQ